MSKIQFFGLVWLVVGLGLLQPGRQPAQAGPSAAETTPAKIDAWIEARMHELRIPGLAVVIVRRGEPGYVRGYGAADDAGRPVTPQTPFLISSFSKSFTALGIMQLVEEGKLDLDAPVQAYLPWFQTADVQAAARITVRHLLYQTSGFSELEGYVRNLERDEPDRALEASVRRLRGSRLNALTGERFEYSNTNYDILGLIIQTVSGKTYAAYIEERIFAPLKMDNSYDSLDAARRDGLASRYVSFFGRTVNYDRLMPYSHSVLPSAGLFASAEDIARYLHAHLHQGLTPDGMALLSPAGVAALHTPGVGINDDVGYAMGWVTFPFPEAAAEPGGPIPQGISHGGEWANYKSLILLIPDRDLAVAVLMNKNLPTSTAAHENIGWNTALLALGLEASLASPEAEFLPRYGRMLGLAIVLLLVAGAALSAKILSRRSSGSESNRLRRILFFILLPLLDLGLAGYLWFVHLPRSLTTLPLALSFEPDVGLIYLLILVMTLGWGTFRTVLAIRNRRNLAPNAE